MRRNRWLWGALVAVLIGMPAAVEAISTLSRYTTFSRQVLTFSALNDWQDHTNAKINELVAVHPGDSTRTAVVGTDTLESKDQTQITLKDPLISMDSSDSLGLHTGRIDTFDVDTLSLGAGGRAWISYAEIDSVATDSLTVIGLAVFSGAVSAGSTLDVAGNLTVDPGASVIAGYGRIDSLDTDSLTVIGPATISGDFTANGNVGIGTDSPSTTLHVDGTITIGDGVGGTLTSDGQLNIQSPAAQGVAVQTGGANTRVFVTSGGIVGVGTTNPGANGLEVEAGTRVLSLDYNSTGGFVWQTFRRGNTEKWWFGSDSADDDFQIQDVGGAAQIPLLIEYASGNVGIGSPADPAAQLDVYDNTATAEPTLKVHQDNASATGTTLDITNDGSGPLLAGSGAATSGDIVDLTSPAGGVQVYVTVSIADGDSLDLSATLSGSEIGMLDVINNTGSCAATFHLRGGGDAVVEMLDSSTCASVANDNAGTVNVYYKPGPTYMLENQEGGMRQYYLFYRGI